MATKYQTFKNKVVLHTGQIIGYLRGKGYYAKTLGAPVPGAGKPPRERLALLMDELIAHEPQVHYAEVRPMRNVKLNKPAYPLTMDCSETVTCLYKWAGLHDPNDLKFSGVGNTETLAGKGTEVSVAGAKTGDALIFLGPMAEQHVCVVRLAGVDPVLFSHGQERGPMFLRLSAERTAHPGQPITVRRYLT